MKQKYGQLKRNFDAVSLHAKRDAESGEKVQKMREEYEAKLSVLTTAKAEIEAVAKESKEKLTIVEAKNKDQATKISAQTKEIENLKKDLGRVQKGLESQLA